MKYGSFTELLQQAILGDMDAINEILCIYEPLIKKHSKTNGVYDEDRCQHIMEKLVERIPKFRI